jgi:hypothetical protein
MKATSAIFYGLLAYAFLLSLGLFVIWVQWAVCDPLSDLDRHIFPDVVIPSSAECFSVSHGYVRFLSWDSVTADTFRLLKYSLILLPICALAAYVVARARRWLWRLDGDNVRPSS